MIMKMHNDKTRLLFAAGFALLAAACSTPEEGQSGAGPKAIPEASSPDATPKPAATLDLPSGNTLEFYDFQSGALVVESGKAGVKAYLGSESPAETLAKRSADPGLQLAALWNSASAGAPLPKALSLMQERWKNPPAGKSVRPAAPTLGAAGQPFTLPQAPKATLAKAAAPVGCNNGCCDYEWLATLGQCQGADWPISWFLFNYGYSYSNYEDTEYVNGLVCAANGNSSWKMSVGGSGGTWTVTPAHYKTWRWLAGWFDEDMRSSVNSSASQALHTYCGVLYR
jgi:hypothetical protein